MNRKASKQYSKHNIAVKAIYVNLVVESRYGSIKVNTMYRTQNKI